MKKELCLQKIMFIVFILTAVAVFIYSLGFMTNYEAFQYLETANNRLVADFHHEKLIPFNNQIFYLSLIGIIMIVVIFISKINKVAVKKVLNYLLALICSVPIIIVSVLGLIQLPGLKTEYNGLDFSYVSGEIYAEYNPSTLAFDIGNVLYVITLILMIIYVVLLTILYFKNKKKVEVKYENS